MYGKYISIYQQYKYIKVSHGAAAHCDFKIDWLWVRSPFEEKKCLFKLGSPCLHCWCGTQREADLILINIYRHVL